MANPSEIERQGESALEWLDRMAKLAGPLSWCSSCRTAFPFPTLPDQPEDKCPACIEEDARTEAAVRQRIEAAVQAEKAACARLVRQLAVRMDDPAVAELIAQHIEARKG